MSQDNIIEVRRPDLLSLLFEERFPYPQIRALVFKGEMKVGIDAKTGSIFMEMGGKGWLTVDKIEGELLKGLK